MSKYTKIIKETVQKKETIRSAMLRLTGHGIRIANLAEHAKNTQEGEVVIHFDFDTESDKMTVSKDNKVILELEGGELWSRTLDYFNKQFMNGNLPKGKTKFFAKTPRTELREITDQIPMAA